MRPLALCLAIVLWCLPATIVGEDWTSVLRRVIPATVPIQIPRVLPDGTMGQTICTGIVLHKKRHYVLTAKHCTEDVTVVTVFGEPAEVVWSDATTDLSIIQTAAPVKGQIQRRGRPLWITMPVLGIGYGYGHPIPLVRIGHLSRVATWNTPNFVEVWYETDVAWVRGMSGGPVVDSEGYLMGIVLWSDGVTGSGLAVEALVRRIPKAFWP